jgi:hypothetical protein
VKSIFFCASLLLILAGCAADPAPQAQLRLAEQSIAQAEAVGATPDVAELAEAQRKLAAALIEMQAERHREARLLAEQAELDARVAEARVLHEKSQLRINELNRRIEQLRDELGELQ